MGDVAYVIEDLGTQVRLSNRNGPYLMPRNMLKPLDQTDYQAHKLAQPVTPSPQQRCQHCGQTAHHNDTDWYRIQDQIACDSCASTQAEKAGFLLPDDIETHWSPD